MSSSSSSSAATATAATAAAAVAVATTKTATTTISESKKATFLMKGMVVGDDDTRLEGKLTGSGAGSGAGSGIGTAEKGFGKGSNATKRLSRSSSQETKTTSTTASAATKTTTASAIDDSATTTMAEAASPTEGAVVLSTTKTDYREPLEIALNDDDDDGDDNIDSDLERLLGTSGGRGNDDDDEEEKGGPTTKSSSNSNSSPSSSSSTNVGSSACYGCRRGQVGSIRTYAFGAWFGRRTYPYHCVIGPHYFGPVCVLSLLLFASIHFVRKSTSIGPITTLVSSLLSFGTAYNMFHTSFRDPGIVTESSRPNNAKELSNWRWCDFCNVYQPPDGAHCPECNVCIAGYDHHCVWLGICVGKRNYKQFMRFNLCWIGFLMYSVVWISVMGPLIYHHHRHHHHHHDDDMNATAVDDLDGAANASAATAVDVDPQPQDGGDGSI